LLQLTAVGSTPVQLVFANHIKWEIAAFTENCAKWISDPEMIDISQVGAMSSPQFQKLIKPLVGDAVCRDFQTMVYSISLAHTRQRNGEKHQHTLLELQRMGSTAGERVLRFLEKKITPQSLGSLSRDELQVLFLMIVGAILAIGYAQPVAESPSFPPIEVSCTT
jgi:AraC-like DNA-binding protein